MPADWADISSSPTLARTRLAGKHNLIWAFHRSYSLPFSCIQLSERSSQSVANEASNAYTSGFELLIRSIISSG